MQKRRKNYQLFLDGYNGEYTVIQMMIKTLRKFQFVPRSRLYHAETQNSWVASEARDTHGKEHEFNVFRISKN